MDSPKQDSSPVSGSIEVSIADIMTPFSISDFYSFPIWSLPSSFDLIFIMRIRTDRVSEYSRRLFETREKMARSDPTTSPRLIDFPTSDERSRATTGTRLMKRTPFTGPKRRFPAFHESVPGFTLGARVHRQIPSNTRVKSLGSLSEIGCFRMPGEEPLPTRQGEG